MPGGVQMGIVYCALPLGDTSKEPAVRPTAPNALVLSTDATTATMAIVNLVIIDVGSLPFGGSSKKSTLINRRWHSQDATHARDIAGVGSLLSRLVSLVLHSLANLIAVLGI